VLCCKSVGCYAVSVDVCLNTCSSYIQFSFYLSLVEYCIVFFLVIFLV